MTIQNNDRAKTALARAFSIRIFRRVKENPKLDPRVVAQTVKAEMRHRAEKTDQLSDTQRTELLAMIDVLVFNAFEHHRLCMSALAANAGHQSGETLRLAQNVQWSNTAVAQAAS